MNKNRILLISTLFCAIISLPACNRAVDPTATPPGVQSSPSAATPGFSPAAASPIPSRLPASPSPTPTLLPIFTATPLPTPTLTLAPTEPRASFLPADLASISPDNITKLSQMAALAEKQASVVAYSPDSRWIATGHFTSNQVKIWDLANGEAFLTLNGHINPRIISYLAFSPDGSQLASGAQGWDASNDSLILWDTNTGGELQRFDGVLGALSPDWRLAALTQREQDQEVTLILSDLASGEEIHILKAAGDIYGVSFSPQGQQVAAKMYDVFQDLFSFWSVATGRLDRTVYDWIGFSYSADGRFIAALLDTGSGLNKGELNIFDAVTFKWIKTLAKGADALWFVNPAFSPDGQILAASFGEQVIFWDTQTWEELASIPIASPTGLAFSPDGRILTMFTQAGMVELWGVGGGQ